MSKPFEKLTKAELVKIWKQLDGASEAIEKLEFSGFDIGNLDATKIVSIKNKVGDEIEKKSRKPHEFK